MKYNILIQQKVISENNLNIDLVDAAILEIISEMPLSSMIEKKYEGNIVFFWVNHLNLAKENPILRIKTADGIYRRMLKMSELGLIYIHPNNKQSKKSFYAISELTTSLFISSTSDEKPNVYELHRMKNRSNIGFKSEVTSDEKPKDYNINDYTINDNIYSGNSLEKKPTKSKKQFLAPTLDDVIEFFKSKGLNDVLARKAFTHYDMADWTDSKGNKVVNWKQKMNTNWISNNLSNPNYKYVEEDLFSNRNEDTKSTWDGRMVM